MTIKFTEPFIRLPVRFDAATLEREVRALPKQAWVPHPTGFPGNDAVRLVTVGGQPTDAFEGPMRPTEYLAQCPYIMEVMAELGGVWGRSRLMGLGAGAEVPEHVDSHYHWRTHLRIHVPILTNPGVAFTCGGETVHMAPGECWLFDSFRWHEVHNRGTEHRVHLVLDTVVSTHLWDLIDAAQSGNPEPRVLRPGERRGEPLMFEQYNAPRIMSAWEIRGHIAFLEEQTQSHPKRDLALKQLDRFADSWAAVWARFGPSDMALNEYRQLAARGRAALVDAGGAEVKVENGLDLAAVADQLIFIMAVNPAIAGTPGVQRLAS